MTKNNKNRFEVIISVLVLLGSGFWVYYFGLVKASPNEETLARAFFLDVGQGDATLFNLPDSTQVLVDAGPDKKIVEQLNETMPPMDRKIEFVFLTHPDSDHIGGLEYVLDSYKIGGIYVSGKDSSSNIYQRLAQKISQKNIPETEVRKGEQVKLADFYAMDVFSPPAGSLESTSTNDSSLVMKLDAPSSGIMLLGDAETKVQNRVVGEQLKSNLKSDVIKISHHGSANGISEKMFSATGAKDAVISVGKNNRYGHPAQATIDVLVGFGMKIFRTDELGAIEFDLKNSGWAAKSAM